jgi:hypothetical protein
VLGRKVSVSAVDPHDISRAVCAAAHPGGPKRPWSMTKEARASPRRISTS